MIGEGKTRGQPAILDIPACTNQNVATIHVSQTPISPEFVFYWLWSQYDVTRAKASGNNQPALNRSRVEQMPFPLAPLAQQRRIVVAIEELFTRLDAGVAALKRTQAALKRYRAAVLKAAVEGKLTEQWRAEHPDVEPASALLARILAERRARWEANLRAKGRDPENAKFEEPKAVDIGSLPELPRGWVWGTIEQLGEVQLGRQRAPQHHTGPHMRPYLRVANVFEDFIDTSDVLRMNFTPEEYEVYRLQYGDILLNEGQSLELVGRPAMYRDEVPGACFQNTLVRFRARAGLSAEFSLIVFRSYLHTRRFQRIGKHTTNIAHLGAGRFSELEFPLPPDREQKEIVSEVERCLSMVSALEWTVATNLKRAERLRRAVLQRAFSGRLVPQDPNDEPAIASLVRIQQDREQVKAKPADSLSYLARRRDSNAQRDEQVGLWSAIKQSR
jgi:type I restriction enzyme S subunit